MRDACPSPHALQLFDLELGPRLREDERVIGDSA